MLAESKTYRQKTVALAAAFAITLAVGCQPKLAFEKTYTLQATEIQPLPIEATNVDQTIYVTASCSNEALFVCHIYLAKNDQTVEQAITTGTTLDQILAASEPGVSASLSAKIPAHEAAVVRLACHGRDTAQVNVKINN